MGQQEYHRPTMTHTLPLTDQLSQRARNLRAQRGWGAMEKTSFIYGFPAPDCLPNAEVQRATEIALQTHGEWPLQYSGAPGNNGLRDILAQKLARDQGIHATRDNLLITVGSSQALALVCDLLLDPGDVVLSEAPTFLGAVKLMKNLGVNIAGVPLDENGVRVDELEKILKNLRAQGKKPKFFYVIPNFQNPTGVTTTLERRKRIVALAHEYDFAIFEDDAYYDLRFTGEFLPPLYALDGGERSFYIGTFSKILSPGMRLGWIVARPDLIAQLDQLKPDGNTSSFSTHVGWEFSKNGGLDTNIARVKAIYKRRHETMQDALTEFMPEGVTWTQPQGGFFIWVTLPKTVDAGEMLMVVRARGVDYLPGEGCYFDGTGKNELRLSFSYAPEDKIAEGIQTIAEEIRRAQRPS